MTPAPPLAASESIRPPDGWDEGFFDLVVQGVPERLPLSVLVDSLGAVRLPLRPVAEHVGIPVRFDGAAVVLEWPVGVWSTRLDPGRGLVIVGDSSRALEPGTWTAWEGELYVAPELLGRVLGARVGVDWPDLAVTVSGDPDYPVMRRRRAEIRRAWAPGAPAPLAVAVESAPTGGAALGWGLSHTSTPAGHRTTGRANLGLALAGGSLELGATGVRAEDGALGVDDPGGRWTRVLPTGRWLRQVNIGQIGSRGVVAHRLVGGALTNRPATTPRSFGMAALEPAVPAGWDVEVYQGGHLVGVSTPARPGALSAELGYGETPVRIRMIGPAGQERVEEVLFSVPVDRVPVGEWWYDVGGGRCRAEEACSSYAFAELDHGVTRWLSLGAGLDRLELDGATFRPHGSVDVSPRSDLTMQLQAQAGGYARGGVSFVTRGRGSVVASYTRVPSLRTALSSASAPPATSPSSASAPTATSPSASAAPSTWAGQVSASSSVGGRWASARLLLRGRDATTVDGWQGALTTQAAGAHVTLEREHGLQDGDLTTLRLFRALPGGRSLARDLAFSLAAGMADGRAALGEAGVSLRPRSAGVLNALLRLRRGVEPVVTVSWSVRAPYGFLQARSVVGSGPSRYVGAEGGVAFGSRGAMALPGDAVGRAGIAARVFRDLDGDGMRSAGEPLVEGVRVDVGGRAVRTGTDGVARTWELSPHETVAVGVDELSVEPGWAPPTSARAVRPEPNAFARVELPLHRTREVAGAVGLRRGDTVRPVAEATVLVLRGDEVVARVRTFHDGVFYIDRLRPGSYSLRLDDGALRALGLSDVTAGPRLDFEVPAAGDEVIELPALVALSPRS